ncbi:MAG: hypothetical protein PHU06_14200 [Gallionella sp.]|nr:hypothetical protein [Gallionella sp.]MDD4960410.1 hypothetical protein [Gallionella sp.]
MLKKNVRIIGLLACLLANVAWAGNAGYCLRYETDSNGSRWLSNSCAHPVEAAWCFGVSCSLQTDGNSWTIQANSRFPITGGSPSDFVKHDACRGANSIKGRSQWTLDCK